MASEPITRIFSASPHLQCPVGPLIGWFTDPPGGVVQLTEASEFTVEMARWVVGPAFDRLIERFPVRSGLELVLDLRPMTHREPIVRTVFMDKAREDASAFAWVTIIPPLQAKGVYLSALQTAAALVSAVGTHLEITSDLDEVLARRGLRAA